MEWKSTYCVTPQHVFPVLAQVDVLVAGGGAAGVAAAETAARRGCRVLLVEKYGFLGGAAVAGLSGTICGLYYASETAKKPEQLVFGFAERFRRGLEERGGVTPPQKYGKTWTVTHDPLCWSELAEDLLQDAGVDLYFHTRVVGVIKEGEVFSGVLIDTKSGMAAIHAKVIIDATGDADVVYRGGLDVAMGRQGLVQNPTMIFRLSDVDVEKFFAYWGDNTISPQKVIDQLVAADKKTDLDYPRKKIWVFDTPRPHELLVNATRIIGADQSDLNVTLPKDHTQAEIRGRKQARAYADFFKATIPGCEKAYLNGTGVEVGVRQTRSILGLDRLSNRDVLERRKRSDGIAKCAWPMELHYGEKPQVDWILEESYEIPFGALIPAKAQGILVAGRNLSAEHEALASARVTAQCFSYGQAAGLAADLSIKEGIPLASIKGEWVRRVLHEEGALLEG